jgi:hypothetical protein
MTWLAATAPADAAFAEVRGLRAELATLYDDDIAEMGTSVLPTPALAGTA